jgi:lipoprotein-anchoring transpeptidase ErfK/SrfK
MPIASGLGRAMTQGWGLDKTTVTGYSRCRVTALISCYSAFSIARVLRMRLLHLPTLPLLALVVALCVSCAASAQAEPQGAPQPESTGAPSNQTGAQPAASPSDGQPETGPTGDQQAPQDGQGESQSGQSESGSTSQAPVSKVVINIDKSRQEMTVFVDGIEQYTWPVSTGRSGYSTPSGTYTPTSMNEIWYSKQWDNSPMPHAIFFMKDGHAIHGSHEVKNLGKPASHGCVRLLPANAAILYDLVKEKGMANTQVVLTGETPGGESKVASQPDDYPGDWGNAPWFAPGRGYAPPPRRRGLFGRWFQPYDGPQGYYRPRGYSPRGY